MRRDPVPFKIEPSAFGAKTVEVNGVDLTDLLEVASVHFVVDRPPQVALTFHPGALTPEIIEGTGIVMTTPEDPDAVQRFLANIDSDLLAEEAFRRLEMGNGTPFSNALDVLREWAEGDTSGTTGSDGSTKPV